MNLTMNDDSEYHHLESLRYTIDILIREIEWADHTTTSIDESRIRLCGTPYWIDIGESGWEVYEDLGYDGIQIVCMTSHISKLIDTVRYIDTEGDSR